MAEDFTKTSIPPTQKELEDAVIDFGKEIDKVPPPLAPEDPDICESCT